MGELRPFRFSVQCAETADRTTWRALARQVEALGYSALYTADHLDDCISPLAPLVTAAEATSTLRVGVLVLNNDFRHPTLLAREAATIDLLTDGRLELGLGAGHSQPEYERNGLRFDAAGVRVSRLEESVQILRRLLDGETMTYHGEHYQLDGERCHPRPVQAHLPVLVGGGGRRVLSIAARHADIVGFTGMGRTLADGNRHLATGFPEAAVDEQVAWVRSQAGDRLPGLELQALVQAVVITDEPAVAAQRIAPRLAPLTPEELLTTPYVLIGSVAQLVDRLRHQRERWGLSHYTVRSGAMEVFAPVVAALAGS